jgi:F420-0:gamma-glutamyl ligase
VVNLGPAAPAAGVDKRTVQQARALLDTVRPRDVVGKIRRWLASGLLHELVARS